MNRNLIAGLFALAIAPAATFSAEAADPITSLTRTVPMGCRLNASDGESLKVRMMLTNTSGYHLPQGSKVRIGIRYQLGGLRQMLTLEQALWRDVGVRDSIGFDQPKRRGTAVSCAATVTFVPNLKGKLERATRPQRP